MNKLEELLGLIREFTFEGILEKLLNEKDLPSHTTNIYIPSKGRANSAKTPFTLDKLGLNYTIVVEPQDAESYKLSYPKAKIEVLDKSNQGIYYVRNYIKDLSTSKGETSHWAIDDDISHFYDRSGTKRVIITDPFMFHLGEHLMAKFYNIGQLGFVHDAFAFTRKTPYSLNKQICSVMLINNNLTKNLKFKNEIIEDTDFSLQVLFSNLTTVTLNTFSYLAPPQMKQKGGNTDDFSNNKLYERQMKLCEEYRPWFKMKVEEGKPSRIMPSKVWSQFKQIPVT